MGSYNVANGLNVKGEQQWAQYGSLRHTPDLSIGDDDDCSPMTTRCVLP